jgi:hypothetical protein
MEITVEPDDNQDDNQPDQNNQQPDPGDNWEPPTKEDYEKLVNAKREASHEAAQRRKFLAKHGIDPKTGEKLNPTHDNGTKDNSTQIDVDREIAKAVTKVEVEFGRRTQTLIPALLSELEEQGWNGRNVKRLLQFIELDDVEIDGDRIVGLTEQVDALKKDLPEWFRKSRNSNVSNASKQDNRMDGAQKPSPKNPPGKAQWAQIAGTKLFKGE